MVRILVVDDEALLARSLARALGRSGHEVEVSTTAEEAMAEVERVRPDMVLLDLKLGTAEGLDVLERIGKLDPSILVLIMTAFSSIQSAVEAMRRGAIDYLCKPLDVEALQLAVERALEGRRLRHRLSYYERRDLDQARGQQLVGESAPFRQAAALVDRIAQLDAASAADLPTVLFEGETGTGKDLLARRLHLRSRLAEQPFVEIDCATLPSHLLEAELFGYEKGAFTDARASKPGLVEVAEGGTLFLNEVGELSLEAQAKFLALIERKQVRRLGGLRERAVDVRIVAASNRDLGAAVSERAFREDLWHRLRVLSVRLPPLRERADDVVLLAEHFLRSLGRTYGAGGRRLDLSALAALRAHRWPGNVRELRHALERAVFVSEGPEITAGALGLPSIGAPQPATAPGPPREPLAPTAAPVDGGSDLALERAERSLIERALAASDGNVSDAARRLGIGREALRYRLRKYGLGGEGPAR
jgi:DNA-binding NtrC family response regulator